MSDNAFIRDMVAKIEDAHTALRCIAERSFLRQLHGGCQIPIAVTSKVDESSLSLYGCVLSKLGDEYVESSMAVDTPPTKKDARDLGAKLANELIEKGARKLLGQEGSRPITYSTVATTMPQ